MAPAWPLPALRQLAEGETALGVPYDSIVGQLRARLSCVDADRIMAVRSMNIGALGPPQQALVDAARQVQRDCS